MKEQRRAARAARPKCRNEPRLSLAEPEKALAGSRTDSPSIVGCLRADQAAAPSTRKRWWRSSTAGVEMDVLGFGYKKFDEQQRLGVVAAHPRGNHFKENIIDAFYQGMAHRPDSTFGTVNDDVLTFKNPKFEPPPLLAGR